MSELQVLFAVVVVLYLLQCVAWVPQESAAFRATFFSGWIQAGEGFLLAVQHIRGVPGNPLPPLNGVAVCQSAPVAVSPVGFTRVFAGPQAFFPFAGMKKISAGGKSVETGGEDIRSLEALFDTPTEGEARRLAAWLEKLRTMPEKKRAHAIEKWLGASLDFSQASARYVEFDHATKFLGWACTALFAYLFLFLPLILDAIGLARVWMVLAATLVLLMAFIEWQFVRAHKRLHPGDGDARWTALITMLLYPVAGIRAKDVVLRDLFAEFHPLAVARVLCEPEEFGRVAARTLREFTFPIPANAAAADEPGVQCESWFRERQSTALRRFLKEAELNPEELLAPPPRSSSKSVSYCPRCCQQYALSPGECRDCGGIPLLPL